MTTPPASTFDRPQEPAHAMGAPSSNRRSILLVALAVIAALVIGGGAWAVTRSLAGGGNQPASALPAETAAYVRLDIDPSLGQKIAAVRFLDGLDDDVLDDLREGDFRETFFEWMAEDDPAFESLDYQDDIEPWLGDRMGMGIVPNGESEPYFGIALQVKDEEAAEAGLTKMREMDDTPGGEDALDWFFHNGYAVLTPTGTVDELKGMVEEGTLADQETFREDLSALGDQGVLSGWIDMEPLAALADSAMAQESVDDMSALAPSGALGMLGTTGSAGDALTGRYAAALRFAEDNIEVHGVSRGLEDMGIEGGESAHLVLDLPENTAAALSQEHGDQFLGRAYAMFKEQFPQEFAEAEAEASEMGLDLPDDLQTMLGSSLVVSVGPGITALEQDDENIDYVEIAYRTATDTDKAEDILTRALDLVGAEPEASELLVRRADDGVLTLGVSKPYVDTVAEGGALGNHRLFKNAVPNAADAHSVFYVNVNTFEDLYLKDITDSATRNSLKQLAAVGFSSTMDAEGNADFTLRFIADE